ncbi:hypothetical protein CLMAG_35090 [Clostridium magnum DSM 2767]|uniref:Uncharacterized protein n=1 Tax=Clostridium magnum DSM 2767 TaxID=1121326 RepID=A0A162SQZ2_9CLOT|nr:hypothetical protein CLMAG_35090 [Clostridium magnum DSM 2767]SHJ03136.1 hypothetical protein SAMN02745944_05240 [Clostridium magnum DSM 2767]
MGLFSRSSEKRHYGDKHMGSDYYKRKGLLGRILRMLGSFSSSRKRHDNHHSNNNHNSHDNHCSHQHHYSNEKHYKKRYKSSWS